MSGRPVLMVHGAWHGPWCWDGWGETLTASGHRPRAVALPGHTNPGSRDRIWNRLGDYVDAVGAELDRLGPETVIIGHSMGGLVTQKALEIHRPALAILVASVPLRGVWGASIRTARDIPGPFLAVNATASMYPIVGTPELTRRAFFNPTTPAEIVDSCHARVQNESYLAYLQMFAVWPRPTRVDTPVRVLAGGDDAIFTVDEQRKLAKAYDTEAVVIEGSGHDLMLDNAGATALDHVLEWIDDLV